jgi:hypothetical protein
MAQEVHTEQKQRRDTTQGQRPKKKHHTNTPKGNTNTPKLHLRLNITKDSFGSELGFIFPYKNC